MKFTHIYWAGGSDLSGHAYRTVNIASGYLHNTVTTFTDNWITGTVDDAIGITGGKVSLLRNVCKWCGSPDGDNLNIKNGVWGEIAYNVIWGPAETVLRSMPVPLHYCIIEYKYIYITPLDIVYCIIEYNIYIYILRR